MNVSLLLLLVIAIEILGRGLVDFPGGSGIGVERALDLTFGDGAGASGGAGSTKSLQAWLERPSEESFQIVLVGASSLRFPICDILRRVSAQQIVIVISIQANILSADQITFVSEVAIYFIHSKIIFLWLDSQNLFTVLLSRLNAQGAKAFAVLFHLQILAKNFLFDKSEWCWVIFQNFIFDLFDIISDWCWKVLEHFFGEFCMGVSYWQFDSCWEAVDVNWWTFGLESLGGFGVVGGFLFNGLGWVRSGGCGVLEIMGLFKRLWISMGLVCLVCHPWGDCLCEIRWVVLHRTGLFTVRRFWFSIGFR